MSIFIWIHIHDVIDDVTGSQRRSNFKIDIFPSIFKPERRSEVQNVGNANGYLSGIFNFRYNLRLKSLSRAQNGGHFEIQFDLRYEKIVPNYAIFSTVITSSVTQQGALKVSIYIHV